VSRLDYCSRIFPPRIPPPPKKINKVIIIIIIIIIIIVIIIIRAGDLPPKKNPTEAVDVKRNSRNLKKSHPSSHF